MKLYAGAIRDWFISYVDSFSSPVPKEEYHFTLKKEHTLRVCSEITDIAIAEGLVENDLRIAQITALLHDVGRFEQYARYKTFSDSLSVNHAELGVAIVKEKGVLRDLSDDDRIPVLDAITCHNRACLPDDLPEPTVLFAKLVRDADKLDILHITDTLYRNPDRIDGNAIDLGLPCLPELSAGAIASVYRESIVNFADVHSTDDFKILQMAWIFDLNFAYSLRQFHERDCLGSLRAALPDNDTVRELYGFLRNKLLGKIASDDCQR